MQSSRTCRVRSWVKRLAMVVLPVLILLCGVGVWDYIETRRLAREIEAIQARGEPTTTGAMYARASNRADNAEYRYSAAGLLSLANEIGDPTVEGRTAMSTYARFTPVRMWVNGIQPRPALTDAGDVTKTLLAEWQDVFSLVDRAAAQPYYGMTAGGEYNYREGVSPWFRSIFVFQPEPQLMAEAPLGFQLHAFLAFVLFAMWPFTRLVHVFSAPIGYLTRPYLVYRSRDERPGAATGTRAPQRGWDRPELQKK